MAADGKPPRDLLVARISRLEKQGVETNKQLAETNKRLDKVVAILSGIANTLVGQGREIERHSQILERHSQILQALTERFDRFSDMVIIGRTRDTKRVGELERRVETRERQVSGRTPPVRS